MRRFLLSLLPVAAWLMAAPLAAAEPPGFESVAPILARHCLDCHNAEDAELALDLSTEAALLLGSETGPVIVPGKAAESLLVQALAKGAEPHMPPKGQLKEEEIAAITAWVNGLDPQVAVGRSVIGEADRAHWAFQPVARPEPPEVKRGEWARTEIDRFILAKLEAAGLAPAPEAEKRVLLRRATFDLTGLPPTFEEMETFLADESPEAFERVLDRLLASPRYGERWGRHWLDLARYADSSGFHEDLDRPHAWRYRDYVIESFNADKPFAEFIREQIAGDELPGATPETWIATAFNRHGPSNDDNMGSGPALEKYRLDLLDDVVSTTSNVFLGLTLACARCHDHKFDPLSQADYYSFLAAFESSERLLLRLEDFKAAEPVLVGNDNSKETGPPPSAMVFSAVGRKPRNTFLLWRGDPQNRGPEVEPRAPEVLEAEPFTPESGEDKTAVGRRLALAEWIAAPENPLTWRVLANRLWQHHFGRGIVVTPSNFGLQGAEPSHPELLDWLADELRGGRSSIKQLHRAIMLSAVYRQSSTPSAEALAADPENRLLARQNKRRLEAEALRDSILAASGKLNLEMGGPGVKPRIRADLLTASQRNKWPVVKQEGPEHWRRSVYIYVKRQLQFPLLELFDAPSTTHSCPQRAESLVPTQALVLLNDEFAREQAGYFAERVTKSAPEDSQAQAALALRIALGNEPSEQRLEEAARFLAAQSELLAGEGMKPEDAERQALVDFCHVLFNLSQFVYLD